MTATAIAPTEDGKRDDAGADPGAIALLASAALGPPPEAGPVCRTWDFLDDAAGLLLESSRLLDGVYSNAARRDAADEPDALRRLRAVKRRILLDLPFGAGRRHWDARLRRPIAPREKRRRRPAQFL